LEKVKTEFKAKNITIISSEKTELAKAAAYEIVATRKIKGVETKEIWYLTIKNNWVYMLMLFTENKDQFSTHENEFKETAKSFEILTAK
jgi:16S rRNA G527 N7-methylase RsmG